MIEFQNVWLKYGTHMALRGIGFQWPRGAFAVVEGHSGAGKSSILRLLATFERPTSGDVLVAQGSIANLGRQARAHYRRTIGYTGADVPLLPKLNCFANVAMPLRILGLQPVEVQVQVKEVLRRVGLGEMDAFYPSDLSGGQQLRLQMARALVASPGLILADEPTAQLDEDSAQTVIELLEAFHAAGTTVVVVTHESSKFKAATHSMVLVEGRIAKARGGNIQTQKMSLKAAEADVQVGAKE